MIITLCLLSIAPEIARRHSRYLRKLAAEMFGALITAHFGNLRNRSRRIFEPVFCKPDARVDNVINGADSKCFFVESLESRAAQVDAFDHGIDSPVKLRMKHHVSS